MSYSYNNQNPTTTIPQRTIDVTGFGKVAIITGCSSGVGLATTQLFLSHQYQVLGVDLNHVDYSLIAERDQERFHFHRTDLVIDGECEEVVRICVGVFGERIDVLANIAGVMDAFAAADVYTDKEWDRVLAVNLTVPTRMIRAVLPFMKAKKDGSIINIASKASVSGAAAGVAYTASKHGLLGVTKNTAWRFHEDGIRCNAILPGGKSPSLLAPYPPKVFLTQKFPAIDTNIASSVQNENFDEASYSHQAAIYALHMTPGQKPSITPMEVANGIFFLASDQARAINGISLPIDKAWGVI